MDEKEFDLEKIELILASDVGSTTTKARLFRKMENGEYRFVTSGEAPTTVEAPFEDVTMGLRNAIHEVEELTGLKLLAPQGVLKRSETGKEDEGVDLYVSTSSAGGGLQMMVAGVIRTMTAESASKAALGAGAIVMDVIAIDDGRTDVDRIKTIRDLRPDMILLAGGTDGGTIQHIDQIVETVVAANPKFRLGDFSLPIVFAGNIDARDLVTEKMSELYALRIVDNIRPTLEVENIVPSRTEIHELFMEHVMSHAPGYPKLMAMADAPIMPTPWGEGHMPQLVANTEKVNVIAVGLGGATTNLYSIYDERFNRTVSANLGMSYSITNVAKTAGIENIIRWLPLNVGRLELLDGLYNKMIRPTTIPQALKSLLIEHAVAREALRMGLAHHMSLVRRRLSGARRSDRGLSILFEEAKSETLIEMMQVDMIMGTGGLLSHAPRRSQAFLMMTDGFQPEGITRLYVDSIFMMPHLGVLSTVHPKAALEIFEKDCLVNLGTLIAPRNTSGRTDGNTKGEVRVTIEMPDGSTREEVVPFGQIKRIPLEEGDSAEVSANSSNNLDLGNGGGKTLTGTVQGGAVGIVIDVRGRPLYVPSDDAERVKKLLEWYTAMEAYDMGELEKIRVGE